MLSHKLRMAVGFTPPFAATFLGLATGTGNLTTYDFGAFTVPHGGGYLVVGVLGEDSNPSTISSVTIDGGAGTIFAQYDGSVWVPHGFAYRAVAAGSRSVSVTFSNAQLRAIAAVWVVAGSKQTAPHAGGNGAWANATSKAASFNIPTNGVALYVSYHANTNPTSWSSATERGDVSVESVSRAACADKKVTTAITPHTETASWSVSDGGTTFGVSWAP
jgi:hypothetical protein